MDKTDIYQQTTGDSIYKTNRRKSTSLVWLLKYEQGDADTVTSVYGKALFYTPCWTIKEKTAMKHEPFGKEQVRPLCKLDNYLSVYLFKPIQ